MRLIDADAFNDWILSHFAEPQSALILTLQGFIAEQPTAYSVDKVVEEFKTDSSVKLYGSQNSDNYMIPVKMAIEIVQQCGVSDDVCEWKSASDGEFIQNPHTNRLYSNEPSMKNVYCNTCGKKIKVVE